jgi:hypothetical protein
MRAWVNLLLIYSIGPICVLVVEVIDFGDFWRIMIILE